MHWIMVDIQMQDNLVKTFQYLKQYARTSIEAFLFINKPADGITINTRHIDQNTLKTSSRKKESMFYTQDRTECPWMCV